MIATPILIIFSLLLLNSYGNNNTPLKETSSSSNDSLILVKMINERENAIKKKDIGALMAQFSDDAPFIHWNNI